MHVKTIYLIRHPRTVAAEGICYGQTDVAVLPEVLEKAVEKVNAQLGAISPEACFSSPLQRCRHLAERLFAPSSIVFDERLKEIDFGRWEMQAWKAIPEMELNEWGEDFLNSHQNGGESYRDLQQRFADFWQELTMSSLSEVLVVAHSGIIKAFLARSLEASVSKVFSIQVDYADVIKVVWHNEKYQEITFL